MKELKRKFKIASHNIRDYFRKLNRKKTFQYKMRYLGLIIIIGTFIIGGGTLIARSFGVFESERKLDIGVTAALFCLKEGTYVYDMNLEGIIPRDEKYEYIFTVSNYENNNVSNVDISYNIKLVTTTNLPLTYEITKQDGGNLIESRSLEQDSNGAWYNVLNSSIKEVMLHSQKQTNTYILKVSYPKTYSNDEIYANKIESVQIELDAKQLIGDETS